MSLHTKIFTKILNDNPFCNLYNLEILKKEGFKYVEVLFPFQINNRLIKNGKNNGIEIRYSRLFSKNTKSYFKLIEKYNIKSISSDYL